MFLFGWFFSIFVLKEKRLFVLIPVSFSLGISFYLILVNLISYIIPVNTTFYLIFFLFLGASIFGLFFYYFKKKPILKIGISKKYFKYLLLIAVFISLTGWLINVPLKGGDNVGIGRAAIPGTILGGNFPIQDIIAPSQLLVSHYAFKIFSAAIDRVTGFPFWFAVDVQVGIFAGLIFLLSFVLIHKIIKNEFIAFMGAILFFFSSGLNVFHIFKGAIDLFKHYILKDHVFAVWKFIGVATESRLRPTSMETISLHWAAVAFMVLLLIIYFFFKLLEAKDNKSIIILSVLTGLLLGFLALSGEAYFLVMIGVILVSTFLFIVFKDKKDKKKISRHVFAALIILLIGLPMALYQGGVFSALKETGSIDKLEISFNALESIKLFKPEYSSISVFFQALFLNFGLGLFFLIPAIIYFRKNRKILFFIVPLIIIPIFPLFFGRFATPVSVRFLYLTEGFGYLLSGLLIIKLMLKANRIEKILLYSFFLIIISGGVIFQTFHTVKTLAMPNRDVFFPQLPAVELVDSSIKKWINTNTTIDDYFFTEVDDNLFLDFGKAQYYFAQNLFFITYYGRFAPISIPKEIVPHLNIPPERFDLIDEAKSSCTKQSLKKLKIKYIYFTPQWSKDLFGQCLTNNTLELVFQSEENKIYKVLNN